MSRFAASRRLLHVGLILALVGFWAVAQRSWVPAAALVPLLGVLLFAVMEVLLPLPITGKREIELGHQLLLGDETDVRVTVNRTLAPLNLRLEDSVPEGLQVVPGTQSDFQFVPSGLGATYRVRAVRRGEHTIRTARVQRVTFLGLFERSVDVPVRSPVTVLPASAKNLGVHVRPRPPVRTGQTTHTMRRGPGDEFFSLRQYQPGDSLGDVNWKATARANRIITNEFLPEEPPRYLIYVDTRATGSEKGEPDVFERSLELASVLVEALVEARAQVGLVLLSYHSLFLVPGSGANQLTRLRNMIKHAQPGHEAPLNELVLAGTAHLPARADAVLITANVYDPSLGNALTLLRSRHGRVTVMAPAYPEVDGQSLDASARRASGSLLNSEQVAALAGLSPYADTVAHWPPDEPIAVTLSRMNMTRRTR